MTNVCKSLSIDYGSLVSPLAMIKDMREQIVVLGKGRSDVNYLLTDLCVFLSPGRSTVIQLGSAS